ncbi:MAG: helix-turn-helix domain-containing protein [Dysosmobacter welbionis]
MRTYSSMKALQLLVALADCEGEISLAQLSAATGIPPSSTHRILQEMQHCGFVIKDEVKKCYRAGFEARLLAIQLQKTNFLYEAARGEMAYLNDLSRRPSTSSGRRIWRPSIWQSWGQKSVGFTRRWANGFRSTVQGEGDPGVEIRELAGELPGPCETERFTGKTLTDAEDLRRELR